MSGTVRPAKRPARFAIHCPDSSSVLANACADPAAAACLVAWCTLCQRYARQSMKAVTLSRMNLTWKQIGASCVQGLRTPSLPPGIVRLGTPEPVPPTPSLPFSPMFEYIAARILHTPLGKRVDELVGGSH